MSTKINVRSPFYLEVAEPAVPSVALDCNLVNLQGMSIDEQGIITLPNLDFGEIHSYTSSDSGFSNNKFATVSTDTARTVSFNIIIPANFTNAGASYLVCDAQATQPALICTGGVTTNGTIPNQTIAAQGNSVTIDLSSYFTQGTDPISSYKVDNIFPDFIQTSVSGSTLTITSINFGGTQTINVEASDGNIFTCDAVQPIQITVNSLPAFDCTTANVVGGSITQDGTITDPLSNGIITAKSLTSGGAHITSVAANTGVDAIAVTLFFDITVPDGYANEGASIICSHTLVQQALTTLPEFTCDTAGLTGQAIYTTGSILKGTAAVGTISSFSPIGFTEVLAATPRSVTFNVTPPSSGYSNSGGSDISCVVNLTQPKADIPECGSVRWNFDNSSSNYRTIQDLIDYETSTTGHRTEGKNLITQTSDISQLVGTNICREIREFNLIYTYDWGSRFIPVAQYYSGTLRHTRYYTVFEVVGFTIIGVWEYNNDIYSGAQHTVTKLY